MNILDYTIDDKVKEKLIKNLNKAITGADSICSNFILCFENSTNRCPFYFDNKCNLETLKDMKYYLEVNA